MAETITHAFVSAKSDSPDSSLVSATEWNDGHIFSNGINGQVLVYDNTQPNNMRWVDGVTNPGNTQSIANPTTSPINSIANVNFNSDSPVVVQATIHYVGISTVGAVTYTANLYIDSILVAGDILSSGVNNLTIRTAIRPIGSHNVHADLISTGSANFTGGIAVSQIFVFGV